MGVGSVVNNTLGVTTTIATACVSPVPATVLNAVAQLAAMSAAAGLTVPGRANPVSGATAFVAGEAAFAAQIPVLISDWSAAFGANSNGSVQNIAAVAADLASLVGDTAT